MTIAQMKSPATNVLAVIALSLILAGCGGEGGSGGSENQIRLKPADIRKFNVRILESWKCESENISLHVIEGGKGGGLIEFENTGLFHLAHFRKDGSDGLEGGVWVWPLSEIAHGISLIELDELHFGTYTAVDSETGKVEPAASKKFLCTKTKAGLQRPESQ